MDIKTAPLDEMEAISTKLTRSIVIEKVILTQLNEKLRNVDLKIEAENNQVQVKTELRGNLLEKKSQLGKSIASLQTSRMVINSLLIDSKNQLNFQDKNIIHLENKLKKTYFKYEKYWEDHQKTYSRYPLAKEVEEQHKKIKHATFQCVFVQREIENLRSALKVHWSIRYRQNQLSIIRIAELCVKGHEMVERNKEAEHNMRLIKAEKDKLQEEVDILIQKSRRNWKGDLHTVPEKSSIVVNRRDLFLNPFPVSLGEKVPIVSIQKHLALPQLKIPVFTSTTYNSPVNPRLPSTNNYPPVEVQGETLPFLGNAIMPEDKFADNNGLQVESSLREGNQNAAAANNIEDNSAAVLTSQNTADAPPAEGEDHQQYNEIESRPCLKRSTAQRHYALNNFASLPEDMSPLPVQSNMVSSLEETDEPPPKQLYSQAKTENVQEASASSQIMDFQSEERIESAFLVPAERPSLSEEYPITLQDSETASNTDASEAMYDALSPVFSPPPAAVSAPPVNAGTSFGFAQNSFSFGTGGSMPSFTFGSRNNTSKQSGAWNFF